MSRKKVLCHVHIYYPKQWAELKKCIYNLMSESDVDLYVTMVEENKQIKKETASQPLNGKYLLVENLGYDIGPFIEILNQVNLDNYDLLVKLHSKRDILTSPVFVNYYNLSGDKWRKCLLSFCSSVENWRMSLQTLENLKVGMVADYRLIIDNEKDWVFSQASEKCNLAQIKGRFVAGTMFAAKAFLFKPLQNKLNITDFEKVDRNNTSDLAHDMERILGNVVNIAGYEITSFDGKKNKLFYKQISRICKFLYHHKISPSKEIIKICGIQIYKKSVN